MDLTIDQYLSNPLGKGAATSALRIVKDEYDARYEALIHIHEEFDSAIYKNKNAYYIHLKIPSETKKDFYYDIVVKIERPKLLEKSILNRDIKIFCNSPSFVFTYANIYSKKKLIIDELTTLLPSEISDPAKVRNPYKLLGIEKTMYYAFNYIKDNFSSVPFLESVSLELNLKQLKSDLRDFNIIMKDIEIIEQKNRADRKKEKEEKQKEINEILHNREHVIGKTKNTQTSKFPGKAKTAKKVKRI